MGAWVVYFAPRSTCVCSCSACCGSLGPARLRSEQISLKAGNTFSLQPSVCPYKNILGREERTGLAAQTAASCAKNQDEGDSPQTWLKRNYLLTKVLWLSLTHKL